MNDHARPRRSKWDTPSTMVPAPALAPAPALVPAAPMIPSQYPATAAQLLDGQVSSLEAASAAAARINAMLISKGKLKLPPGILPAEPDNKQKQVKLPVKEEKGKSEPLVAEVEINEVPIQCRNMLTKGSTQEEISRLTGAAVSTRGRYMSYADRATNNMGERPLYLCVQGPTRESVDRAVEHIKALIGGGIQNKGVATTGNRTRTRFSAATTGPATAVNTRPPGAPIFSRPPAPGLGAQMRAPGVGGDVRGPAGGVRGPGPNPMIPPPAIQLAIQAAQSSGHYLQDKVFIGLEHADPSFNMKEKIQGPGGSFLQHIRAETGANIYLRGRGSGFMEPTSGREAFENLYMYVTHPKADGLQAAKKLCENLVTTIQAEYVAHQSLLFQRSAPALAAAHMIAPPARPGQPVGQAIPQPPSQQLQQPGALGLYSQAQPTVPAVSTAFSQTLAAQQHAQAILGAQRPVVSTAVSGQPGIVYPHLIAQPQPGLPGQPGLALQARAPQPVPAPAPVPPPQRLPPPIPQVVVPAASQAQIYAAQVAVSQSHQSLAQAQAQAAVQAAQAQAQAQVHSQAQLAQAQAQLQLPVSVGIAVGQQVLQQPLGPPPQQQQQLQQQPQQSAKRRFREDLVPERPEHHPPPMTNLGVSPPGHSPLGIAGAMAGVQGSLLGLPGQPPEDRRLMPPPPNPHAMRDAARKRLLPPQGLDIHGGRIPSPEESRIKRGRLVSYDTSGDSDEDEDAAGRARTRFDAGPRFQPSPAGGYMAPPPRGLPPPSSHSTSTSTSSSFYKVERREPGPGGSPFWMARN
ncbi:KH homology domain-containing protein 4-like [Lytechinus pictus]|uniref:KH homology domain-containing protein 4-like n=1 Tax=Lytechinus pictus TaxID=7653 RepID=UPI0030B9AEC5